MDNNENNLYARRSNVNIYNSYTKKNVHKYNNSNKRQISVGPNLNARKKALGINVNNNKSVFGKRESTTNYVRSNNNVRNNTNSVKQALDNKINNDFSGKEYALIVHFKGFNNLFKDGVYNGYSNDTLETMGLTDVDKISHIEDIAREYFSVIKKQLDNDLIDKNLLLVWDGDGLEDFQWTRVIIATAKRLVHHGANIEFLCIPEDDKIKVSIENNLSKISELKNTNINYILQTEINIDSVGWAVAGMCNMYVTSKINRKNNQPILVLCAGGGKTPLDEYNFMKNQFVIPDSEKDETKRNIYNNVIKLADENMPNNFKWMASSKVHSRKSPKGGVELSKMIPNNENEIEMINLSQSVVTLTNRGGARKKRTKKKKSSKKNKSKSKSKNKRKC